MSTETPDIENLIEDIKGGDKPEKEEPIVINNNPDFEENFNSVDIDDLIDKDDEKPLVEAEAIEKKFDEEDKQKKKEVETSKKKLKGKDRITDEYITEVISDFINHFKKKVLLRSKITKDIKEEEFVYYDKKLRDIAGRNSPLFIINFKDIVEYRTQKGDKQSISNLIYLITNKPYKVRKIFTQIVKKLFKEIYKEDFETNLHVQYIYNMIQVGFSNFQDKPTQLNVLRTFDLSKYVTVEGVISQYDEIPRVNILESTWNCDDCGRTYHMKGGKKPPKCINKECYGREFTQDLALQVNEDYIDIRLTQQFSGLQKNNTVDRYVRISGTALVDYVLNNVSPGQIAIVNGVVTLAETKNKDDSNNGDIEVDAFHIEHKNNINIFDYDERLLTIVKDYINESNIEKHVAKLKRSISSHIYKQEMIREAVLLQMIGTNARRYTNGTRKKGDLNILLAGPSGVAKSDHGIFIQNVLPLSMRAGTSGSTTMAGLTTFVETNQKTGKKMISLGVLALADKKGVAIIEEINRRNKQHLAEFATATDDNQQILVNKGGFHSIIYSRCPIFSTANSLENDGDWDYKLTVQEQTHLEKFVLDRIDLTFVVDNSRTKEHKRKMMSHVEDSFKDSVIEKDYDANLEGVNQVERIENVLKEVEISLRKGDFSGVYPIEYLRHEIFYLHTIDCVLKEDSEAYKMLRKYWEEFSDIQNISTTTAIGEDSYLKAINSDIMGMRQFTTLTKIAEIYGRLYRVKEPTKENAQMTIDMMSASIQSTLPRDNSLLTDEEQNEYAMKMLNKSTIKSMAESLSKEELELKRRAYNNFEKQLRDFNTILYKLAYSICRRCHGTGSISEIVDTELKTSDVNKCLECEGEGGFKNGFTYLDFERMIIENQVMGEKRCKRYFKTYQEKKFIVYDNQHGEYKQNINLKSPDVIDSLKTIAEHLTEAYIEKIQKDKEVGAMNKKLGNPVMKTANEL